MIAYLRGIVRAKDHRSVTLDVHDVGYRVAVGPEVLDRAASGSTLELYIEMIVREDAHDLYGFATQQELEFFRLLISVNGVGPKSAMTILSVARVSQVERAVREDDPAILTKVSGVGRKTAERIIIELREKISVVSGDGDDEGVATDDQSVDALVKLGYSAKEARLVLKSIPPTIRNTGERVRHALKLMGK
jgi:Holliday junction DNA helicase RuvA